jgi:hypothetical protein
MPAGLRYLDVEACFIRVELHDIDVERLRRSDSRGHDWTVAPPLRAGTEYVVTRIGVGILGMSHAGKHR